MSRWLLLALFAAALLLPLASTQPPVYADDKKADEKRALANKEDINKLVAMFDKRYITIHTSEAKVALEGKIVGGVELFGQLYVKVEDNNDNLKIVRADKIIAITSSK